MSHIGFFFRTHLSPFALNVKINAFFQNYAMFYLNWTILLLTGILPLATMAYLNTRIYFRIKEVQKVRTKVATQGR